MLLRVSNLRLNVEQSESELPREVAARIGRNEDELVSWRILRKSLDARSRNDLKFVYSVAAEIVGDDAPTVDASQLVGANVEAWQPKPFDDPIPGPVTLSDRPVIVGSGPAGLFAAYYLAQKGYRPLIIERGFPIKERVPAIRRFDRGGEFEAQNNYLFGEGGAGTFSDGKLTCRITGPDVDWVLGRFVAFGGKASLIYEHRPHLGSNRLPMIVRNVRREVERLGGEYRFECCLEKLDVEDGIVRGLHTSSGFISAGRILLGIGHSARDTYECLHSQGVPMVPRAFQLGLRIEQPQDQINRHKYGRSEYEELLGAADYTLTAKATRDVYSFCMCAGGMVIPSVSEPGQFCTNGMSNSRHDTPFANSGLMVTLQPHEFGSDHPLAGVALQRQFEAAAFERGRGKYLAPIQRAADFLARRRPHPSESLASSYQRGTVPATLDDVLPPVVSSALRSGMTIMDKNWKGDFLRNATLVGPEMRGSSPVRIERDRQTFEAPGFSGLYPIGEGAGYAGGIISAAVDGLRAAREIVRQFSP